VITGGPWKATVNGLTPRGSVVMPAHWPDPRCRAPCVRAPRRLELVGVKRLQQVNGGHDGRRMPTAPSICRESDEICAERRHVRTRVFDTGDPVDIHQPPPRRGRSLIAATSAMVPTKFDAAATATSLVPEVTSSTYGRRADRRSADPPAPTEPSPVPRLQPAPMAGRWRRGRALSMISSPGDQVLARGPANR
jgi:hypothetical protein